jgi:hypothetical protein
MYLTSPLQSSSSSLLLSGLIRQLSFCRLRKGSGLLRQILLASSYLARYGIATHHHRQSLLRPSIFTSGFHNPLLSYPLIFPSSSSSVFSRSLRMFSSTTILHSIIKSKTDHRQYAEVVLPNQLQAIIISDPSIDHAAASLAVGVGSLLDPSSAQGMAHFVEHMLFLGTEKVKDDDDDFFLSILAKMIIIVILLCTVVIVMLSQLRQ